VPTSPTRRAPLRKPSADHAAAATPGEIRLIGGRWKRSKLPVADHPGLRPTPDRVRETLFNWLGQDLAGWRVLDAFAGTGALGFEAASRGAGEVLLLEHDQTLALHLHSACRRLDATMVRVVRAEALGWMARREVSDLDLVLLDPPFGANVFDAAVRAALPLLTPEGWLYVEADRAFDEDTCAAWGCRLHRHGRAGMVHFHLLQRGVVRAPDYTGA
jgi:16S rRNA (guanine966-N2)-methyltransferase